MARYLAVADGSIEEHRHAADFANKIQDTVNMRAITAAWIVELDALRKLPGMGGDAINNHPSTLAFISKLMSLSRITSIVLTGPHEGREREHVALDLCEKIAKGEKVEYEVIPL